MIKRIVSITMLVTMMVSFLVPGVYAAGEENYIDSIVIENGNVPEEYSDFIVVDEPDPTVAAEETTAPVVEPTAVAVTETTEPEAEEDFASLVPSCDCGSPMVLISGHSDICAAKQFYNELCEQSAGQIYSQWTLLPKNGQSYIMTRLGWSSRDKLKELVFLLASNWEYAEELKGVAAAIKDDTIFGAFGIPEDSDLQIREATAEAKAAIDSFMAQQGSVRDALFTWDISVFENGMSWQPDGFVRVELELPGEKLHKHTKVYVIHVDDEGNAEKIPAEVIDGNKIVFETNGFSTFAGFTVDFEYDGTPYSIPGMSSILLSELMDKLEMPFDVEQVTEVVFSNPELLSVAKEGADWRLTSLQAFTSEETLTMTMNDGKVYVVNVTDATYVTISFNKSENLDKGTLGVVEWYLLGSGSYGQAYSKKDGYAYAPGWTEDYDIFIDGTGATNKNFEIVLQRHDDAEGDTLYVDLHTVWIKGGANLTFRLGSSINKNNTKKVIVRQVRGYRYETTQEQWWFGELFWIESGSLNLSVPYTSVANGGDGSNVHEGVQIVIDWDHFYYETQFNEENSPKPYVSLREGATSFKANQCVFRDTGHTGESTLTQVVGAEPAIVCRSNGLSEFTMTACEFENTYKSTGNGSAIYLYAQDSTSDAGYVQVHSFNLTNCTFTNCKAAKRGGAISIQSYVHKGSISGCVFTNCTAGTYGGAMELSGNLGRFTVSNSTFTDCSSVERGGGVALLSDSITRSNGNIRYSRSNAVTFTGCTFTNCDASNNHGGGLAVQAQVHTLTVSDCDFQNCDSGVNGGGISIDGMDLPNDFADTNGANWCAGIDEDVCTQCTDYGTVMTKSYNWKNLVDDKTTDKKSWINTVVIDQGCTFTNCTAGNNGGSIEFAAGCYITNSASISNATVSESKAVGEGSAIFWSTCFVKSMSIADSIFQDCTFTGTSENAGGTVKTTGKTTMVLDVQRCQFLRNNSHHHGGGLYWNANRNLDDLVCSATVNNCTFDDNKAVEYGGGIYVESKITITNCNIKNNKAYLGGGIAQQVYNNPGARMLDANGVTELKLDPNTWVHHNEATNGGGISIRANETGSIEDGKPIPYTVRFELNGAAVYENTASKDGGGIYFIAETSDNADKQAEVDMYTKVILINQGEGTSAAVYKNSAGGNGGGIYMESSENTELRVQGGFISSNTANNGGGIYMTGKNATCYVEGGTIGGEGNDSKGNPLSNIANKASDGTGGNGGGIAISGGSNIDMSVLPGQTTGGTISYNKAGANGGGVWLDERVNGGVSNKITIAEGSIIYNTASGNGGGIAMYKKSEATLNGGKVSNNTATENGGGLYVYHYANLTVSGGTIENNTATNGSGGGVFSIWYGKVTIKEKSTIKGNKALKGCGGGVFAQRYNVEITGGEICNNQAKNGAGVGISSTPADGYKTTISGGSIHNNTATGNGGGLFNQGCAHVTVSGGDIYSNKAYNGAGVYAEEGGTTKISATATDSGDIYSNTASNRGGGLYVEGSNIIMEGGSIYSNVGPNSGGGMCVMSKSNGDGTYTPSTITMSNGDIYSNTAANGWGGGIYMWGTDSKITLSGGDIHDNTTGGCGGGINAESYCSIEILGGKIYKNTAGTYGGGIQIYNHASATITGGEIYENTGTNGGGIAVTRASAVSVTDSADGSTVGMITKNNAVNGGGVFVDDRSDLYVKNAFITYNNAKQMPSGLTTSYKLNEDSLKGTGGGIYVADGNSSDPSTFTLEGTNVAIYGNLADFAADDVFSNGNYTKLNVPYVSRMNLSGYDRRAEGWFEDYNINDSNYGIRLGKTSSSPQGSNVRYRGAAANKRFIISEVWNGSTPNYSAFSANLENAYVCMTLGIPAAVSDTIVIDYGLTAQINLLKNDILVNNGEVVGIGAVPKVNGAFVEYSEKQIGQYANSFKTAYGTTTLSKGVVTYVPSGMSMPSHEEFAYAIKYSPATVENDYYYYGLVRIIPATIIYYEDSFLSYKVFQYTQGTNTRSDITNKTGKESYQWSGGTDTTGYFQDEDRVGFDDLETIDANNLYGTDSNYSNMITYSLNGAKKFTASINNKNLVTYGTAEFTFTGTGFDVISMTDNTTGFITVQVYNATGLGATRPVPSGVSTVWNHAVDTYYGYRYNSSTNTWTPSNTSPDPDDTTDNLYQVPVIKCKDLSYGTYTVIITVSYADFFDHNTNDKAYDFYLDAIRIYDPANDGANNKTIEDAYVADKEGWPEYLELRNLLIKAKDFDALDETSGGTASGILFIDGKGNINGSNGNENKHPAVTDYTYFGPNNETYLKPGQSLAFNFTTGDNSEVASVQIGLKSVGGTAKVGVFGVINGTSVYALGTAKTPKSISTATDMYYDITDLLGNDIVITNAGGSADSILSVTNIKVTYKKVHTDSIDKGYFKSSKAIATNAVMAIEQYYSNLAVKPAIDIQGATLSFEDEILTNLYYTTTDLAGVTESDMGLLTWSVMPDEVSVDNAENVYAGAAYVAESGRYMVQTDGIAAKELGDDIYMAVYAQLGDGTYVYSDVITYSPKQYAMSRLEKSDNENLKALCVAMLNYGAAAQTYFSYKTDDLMNAELTAQQQSLVASYDAGLFNGAVAADTQKTVHFVATDDGFGGKSASVSFEGAFAINYYFAVDKASNVTFYYWTKDAYENAEVLTADNASGTMNMTAENGVCHGQITGVAAKQLDDTYYVAAGYTVDGETYCTGVIAYSLSTYCMRNAASNMGELARATAVYGYHAKAYFG